MIPITVLTVSARLFVTYSSPPLSSHCASNVCAFLVSMTFLMPAQETEL